MQIIAALAAQGAIEVTLAEVRAAVDPSAFFRQSVTHLLTETSHCEWAHLCRPCHDDTDDSAGPVAVTVGVRADHSPIGPHALSRYGSHSLRISTRRTLR